MWLGCAVMAGCAALVIGAGAGAGGYTYVNGELSRSYAASFSQTMEVCSQVLQDLNMPVKARSSDSDQTTIETERKDGTPMTINVKILGMNVTQVSVRTGVVGYWNRDLSGQFHELIAPRLGG
jgi:hypothetical protein